ncbi:MULTISPECIES: tyrosine-type recombinase/integrase [unclassified Sphingobacterium]|uniref:tyrosine-type recombinase/integrase n=1 Tax=unclassified Sphingobacterium TaxID=2609468 RepID=UPI0025CED3A6|nr:MULTISPECIES: site-specific integrase [unclassified Sphingobacterium]
MTSKPYKNINIIRSSNGDWRVRYEFELPDYPGKFKKFYVRDGINYVRNLEEKEKAVQQLKEDIEHALKKGFNPFLPEFRIQSQLFAEETEIKLQEDLQKVKPWTIEFAFTEYINYCTRKNLSPNTIRTYNTFINNLKTWLNSYDLNNKYISDFSSSDLIQFLDESFDQEEWSARTYNNHITFLKTFFKQAYKIEKKQNIEISYLFDPDDLEQKKDRAEKNRYYTPAVAEKIKKECQKFPDLFNYMKWIFYSCMRPREIRLLQVQHIDLVSRQIKAIAPTAKTGDRFIPICDELYNMILLMKLTELPPGYFVFGKKGQSNKEKCYKDHFSNLYKPIKDKVGLDDKYTLYGWKHTRVVNLLSAGFTDPEVMSLTGHRDYESFQTYKRELIVDSSSMKGKTISF